MTRTAPSRPARRALRRQHSRERIWLAIGISLNGLILTSVALAAGPRPQGGHYVAGAGTITAQPDGLQIIQPGSTRGVIDWNSLISARETESLSTPVRAPRSIA